MNQISIARALVSCNRLTDSISDKISASTLSFVTKNGVNIKDGTSKKDLTEKVKRDVQSIDDTIDEMFRLRKGINKINAETMIKIGDQEMTIVDALAYRHYILPKLRSFRDNLVSQRQQSTRKYQEEIANKERIISEASKNDTNQRNILEETIKVEMFSNEELLERLNKRIEFFDLEFDSIMTELNPSLKFDL